MRLAVRKRPFDPDALRYNSSTHAVCTEHTDKHRCKVISLPPRVEFIAEDVSNAQVYARFVSSECSYTRPAAVVVYGQTGAGKTHTLEGLLRAHARARLAAGAALEMSALEVYNDKAWDVLARPAPAAVRLRAGLCRPAPSRAAARHVPEFRSLLRAVQRARFSGQSKLNLYSSRSHMIYTVYEKDQPHGTLFVDLAGNEKTRFSYCHRESAHINQSLFAFKECLRALEAGGGAAAHVPFRRSLLTRLLRPLFTGHTHHLVFIAALHPAPACIADTVDTMRYVQALARFTPPSKSNPPRAHRPAPPAAPPPSKSNPPRAHRRVRAAKSEACRRRVYMDRMLKGILSLNYYMQVEYHMYHRMRRPDASEEDWERHRQRRNANLRNMEAAVARQQSL